jgi:hypothetical protein
VKALEATKQLLVSLAEQVYSRIANSLTAPTTSAGAAGGSEAAAQVKDALAAQQLMSRNGDVLDALCQCGTQLRAAGARNAPFLLTLCRDLKATAELGGGGGAVPSAGGLAAKQIDAGRSVRQRETVGAGTAVKAVHALIACGARARRSVAFQIDASAAEPKRAAKQVPQVGDGLRLILHHPSSAAASRSHASHLNSSFDPEQSRRSADRGFGLDDYSDEESGHDDTEGGEAAMVVSLDELVSDLHRQMKWLKSREVDFEAVESALRDLSSLRNG